MLQRFWNSVSRRIDFIGGWWCQLRYLAFVFRDELRCGGLLITLKKTWAYVIGCLRRPAESPAPGVSAPAVEKILAMFSDDLRAFAAPPQAVDIVIPVHNGFEFLGPLLQSVLRNTTPGTYRLIIVDDFSTDPRVGPFLAAFRDDNPGSDVLLVTNRENLGFVQSVNLAVKQHARSHFVILNTDVEVPPLWLERLMYPIFTMKKVASTTPFTNAGTICSFPEWLKDNALPEGLTVEGVDRFFQQVHVDKTIVRIPTGIGFCMGVNKDVVDAIGMFDEAFGLGYGEENDWCRRAIKAGYVNLHVTNLFVFHNHGGSFLKEEKRRLQERNRVLLAEKHPDYHKEVARFIQADELGALRSVLAARLLAETRGMVLFLDHALGGGANQFAKRHLRDQDMVCVLAPDRRSGRFTLAFSGRSFPGRALFTAEGHDTLKDVIAFFKVREVVVNSIVSFPRPLELLDLIAGLEGVTLTYMVHDYYCGCPMFNLLDDELRYCGIPESRERCGACLRTNPLIPKLAGNVLHAYPGLGIGQWREHFFKVLAKAAKIVCFSNSSKQILMKCHPGLSPEKIRVAPHAVDWVRPVAITPTTPTVNVAVPGHVNISKGYHVVSALASYIALKGVDMRMHFFGKILEPQESISSLPSSRMHGPYEKSDLPRLMEANAIDIVLIPSICPETFSYTTEEALRMGLPVAVFDVGAPAERVKTYQRGLVLESTAPADIVAGILGFLGRQVGRGGEAAAGGSHEKITFVCVSNNELVYAAAVGASAWMTEHPIRKYDNRAENVPIPLRYNEAVDVLLREGYNGWIFFVHNDFAILQDVGKIVEGLDRHAIYGPIGAVLENGAKKLYGQIHQGHDRGFVAHGEAVENPKQVDTLDCQCVFLHSDLFRKHALRFSEDPVYAFHQYAEEFCLNASRDHGIASFAVQMDCKHLSWGKLDAGFYKAMNGLLKTYPDRAWAGTCTHLTGAS
ncbi:Glycosyltransferase, GT2 family [Desulfonatronum zhilinae]|nr:Glycosyltransferase, GT2 family [Desulfonatronum zhilinae]